MNPLAAPSFDPRRIARPEIVALAPYASARSLAASTGVLLNANENPWAPETAGDLRLNRYPEPQPAALRARLAAHYGVRPTTVLMTRGSDEGIDLLVRVFCRAGRDRVVICPPCFGLYALSARIQGADVVAVPLREHGQGFALDLTAMDAAMDAQQTIGVHNLPGACRLVFVCSPNNPTGDVLSAADIRELCQRAAGTGLVVVDEAYVEFSDTPSASALLDRHPNLVVLRTLSKAHALAGCRLGAVIARPAVIDLLRRIIAPYPLPAPSVAAAERALAPDALARMQAQLRILADEKQRLLRALAGHAAISRVWPGHANFILVRAANGPALVQAAAGAGIRLRDQSAQPGLADCVRITVGSPADNDALLRWLAGWTP